MTATPQVLPSGHADLDNAISAPRFATFQLAAGGDDERARELYVWNRDLSVAFLADIAILEVALRNAMHNAAARKWGPHWYGASGPSFDDRSCRQLSTAWSRLPKAVRRRADDDDVPGRLVAHCMFGFWTNLLDAGDHSGQEPRKVRVNYEDLWATFKSAFPGGRQEARTQRDLASQGADQGTVNEPTFVRSWVHGICKNVNELRNRVAHHEPLINGFPLNGQDQRMSAQEAHDQCRMLARILDRRLAVWLDTNSKVPAILAARP